VTPSCGRLRKGALDRAHSRAPPPHAREKRMKAPLSGGAHRTKVARIGPRQRHRARVRFTLKQRALARQSQMYETVAL